MNKLFRSAQSRKSMLKSSYMQHFIPNVKCTVCLWGAAIQREANTTMYFWKLKDILLITYPTSTYSTTFIKLHTSNNKTNCNQQHGCTNILHLFFNRKRVSIQKCNHAFQASPAVAGCFAQDIIPTAATCLFRLPVRAELGHSLSHAWSSLSVRWETDSSHIYS
jgi:hypothetical protein